MFYLKRNKVLRSISIVLFVCNLAVMSGCSVIMAARQPDYKDLNVLAVGAPRTRVIAELGTPILTEEKNGKKVDVFSFKQGYGKGNKAARAFFHAAADVYTLFLWEIIATPTEAIASGKQVKIEVTYTADDKVETINYIDLKKKQTTPTSVREAVKEEASSQDTQKSQAEPAE